MGFHLVAEVGTPAAVPVAAPAAWGLVRRRPVVVVVLLLVLVLVLPVVARVVRTAAVAAAVSLLARRRVVQGVTESVALDAGVRILGGRRSVAVLLVSGCRHSSRRRHRRRHDPLVHPRSRRRPRRPSLGTAAAWVVRRRRGGLHRVRRHEDWLPARGVAEGAGCFGLVKDVRRHVIDAARRRCGVGIGA
ncbi:hypothetical protein DFJ73DRAFT_579213 [Zopfochytrium polystomum]|nr:hypothetical protein DFJ73DRAFT_579213 [Zopfochytrium polystomum]